MQIELVDRYVSAENREERNAQKVNILLNLFKEGKESGQMDQVEKGIGLLTQHFAYGQKASKEGGIPDGLVEALEARKEEFGEALVEIVKTEKQKQDDFINTQRVENKINANRTLHKRYPYTFLNEASNRTMANEYQFAPDRFA